MKRTSALIATHSLLGILGVTEVQAEDVALSFEFPPVDDSEAAVALVADAVALPNAQSSGPLPLAIPQGAENPPMRSHQPHQLPAGVYRQAVAAGLSAGRSPGALLPPAPPVYAPVITVARSPQASKVTQQEESQDPELEVVALSFDVAPLRTIPVAQARPEQSPNLLSNSLAGLFVGGTDSLVARAVGSAEGTRTPNGGITPAYYGHSDPGNGVWNMGTFSYQHGAKTAADADQKQLRRLQSQSEILKRRAVKQGLNLNLEETLNGIDLANQSPLASIGRVGYIERLVEARNMGHSGFEAIVVARTRSYINPDTQRWNAPGLGNTLESITRDQRRRADAVAKALAVYKAENPHTDWDRWALVPTADSSLVADQPEAEKSFGEQLDEVILSFWTGDQVPVDQTASKPVLSPARPPRGGEPDATALEDSVNRQGTSAERIPVQNVQEMIALELPTSVSGDAQSLPSRHNQVPNQAKTWAAPGTEIDRSTSSAGEPSWWITREKNQSTALTLNSEPVPLSESSSLPDPRSDAEAMILQQKGSLMQDYQDSGAVPETKVLPPLREDMESLKLPGFASSNQPAPSPQRDQQEEPPQSLPEGLVEQLKAQITAVKQDSATGLKSVQEQVTEAILDIDLSTTFQPD